MGNGVYSFSNLAQFPEIFQGVSMKVSPKGNSWDMLESVNREAFLKSVAGATGTTRMLWAQQSHGDTIFVYRPGDPFPSLPLLNTDAFITSAEGVGLLVKIADCQPILFYDPTRRIVGAVHSGWRGSVKNILGKTVQRMGSVFGVNPKDLHVAIGPSLGPCCATFSNPDKELPPEILKHRRDEKRIDFWEASMAQLREVGVLQDHMECARRCTVCQGEDWFSHRANQGTGKPLGRSAAVIGLQPRNVVDPHSG